MLGEDRIGSDRIGNDRFGLDWIGLEWVELDWIGQEGMGSVGKEVRPTFNHNTSRGARRMCSHHASPLLLTTYP